MMRKDVSGGQSSKNPKKWWEKAFQEVKVQQIRKNDEKRRFRRSKFKKSEKMMRKDVSGGQNSKNPKKWWEKTLRRWRGPNSKNPKKRWEKTFQ
jgi:hypothetical protein